MTAPEMFSLPELRMFKHALKLSADKEGYVTRQQCGSALTLRLSREPDSAENKVRTIRYVCLPHTKTGITCADWPMGAR